MNSSPQEPLFHIFPASSYEAWRKEVDRVLKGDSFEKTLLNSDYIVVNTREVGYSVYVGGSAEGIPLLSEKDLDVEAYPDIGEVIIGKAKGRSSPQEKTLFLSNIGLGTQFAAVAAKVYEQAQKRNFEWSSYFGDRSPSILSKDCKGADFILKRHIDSTYGGDFDPIQDKEESTYLNIKVNKDFNIKIMKLYIESKL